MDLTNPNLVDEYRCRGLTRLELSDCDLADIYVSPDDMRRVTGILLTHAARILVMVRRFTPGMTQVARRVVLSRFVRTVVLDAARTTGDLERLGEDLRDAVNAVVAQRPRGRQARCMCYLNPKMKCWHADKERTADHVVTVEWDSL